EKRRYRQPVPSRSAPTFYQIWCSLSRPRRVATDTGGSVRPDLGGLLCDRKIRPAGFEPATDGLENRCSILLSYGRIIVERRSSAWRCQVETVPTIEGAA